MGIDVQLDVKRQQHDGNEQQAPAADRADKLRRQNLRLVQGQNGLFHQPAHCARVEIKIEKKRADEHRATAHNGDSEQLRPVA